MATKSKNKKKKYKLSDRLRKVLQALDGLGGVATTKDIAEATKVTIWGVSRSLTVSGASQSLKALETQKYIERLGGEGGDMQWQLKLPQ